MDNQPVEVRIAAAKADREAILAEYLTAKMIIEEEQRKLSSQFDDVPIRVKVRFQMAQDDLNAIDQTIENLQNGQKSEVTNKSYWEGKKQQAETELSALSEIDAMGRKGQEIKKRIEGYNNKLQAYSLNTDRRDLKKEAEERIRQEQQRSDELLALRRKNQQAEIDLMQEGADKKYAQLKLDYEIQIEELRKQEKKWREAQNGQLTEDQQAELDFGSQMADSEKQRETDDYLKGIL